MAILERWHHAYHPIPLVLLHRFGGRRLERALGLRHRLALRLRRGKVFGARDRVDLRDLPCRVIDDHLRELGALHRVDGQLQLVVVHFVLRGDRPAFTCAGAQPFLQGELHVLQRLGELRVLRVVVLLRPASGTISAMTFTRRSLIPNRLTSVSNVQSSPWWPKSAPSTSNGMPFRAASAASANANFASGS